MVSLSSVGLIFRPWTAMRSYAVCKAWAQPKLRGVGVMMMVMVMMMIMIMIVIVIMALPIKVGNLCTK
jgi:hypothetical protein